MEIKVLCDCGQKFKFDVQPVNGRMPYVLKCPVCGADDTAKANILIAQAMPAGAGAAPAIEIAPPPPGVAYGAAVAPAAAPVVAISIPPAAAPATAPAGPAPMRVSPGLRISGSTHSQPVAAAAEPAVEEEMVDDDSGGDDDGGVTVKETKIGWKIWVYLGIALVVGLISFAHKWYDRVTFLRNAVLYIKGSMNNSVVGQSINEATEEAKGPPAPPTLNEENGTMILIKTTNDMAVAQACSEYWAQRFQQKLFVNPQKQINEYEMEEAQLYIVRPVNNGIVQVDGSRFTEDKQQNILIEMSQFVSRKFGAQTICAVTGDDAEYGVFIIYEAGQKKFRLDRGLKRTRDDDYVGVSKVEGQDWAKAQGYKQKMKPLQPDEKPKKEYEDFAFDDADDLTQHIGFKFPDRLMPDGGIILQTSPIKR